MPDLGDRLAELLARGRRAAQAGVRGGLPETLEFGSNPGALRMRLFVPDALPAKSPLVVVLHGCGQTAAGYAGGAGWLELAERHAFAVLCPEQRRENNANLCFNWFEDADTRRELGEAASIAQMIRCALGDLSLDPDRVFVTGLSAGGAMAAAMLATYPELFAAGAIIAGLPYGAASGVNQAFGAMRRVPDLPAIVWGDKVRGAAPAPARWPRVAVWRGEADATVSPAAADALVLQWRDVHDARTSSAQPTSVVGHAHTAWRRPDGEIAVELHSVAGLGHGTPIDAMGIDGCGAAAPWILEAGLSSSREMARSWRIVARRREIAARAPEPTPPNGEAARASSTLDVANHDISQTINRALGSAGLLR